MKRKTRTIRNIVLVAAGVVTGVLIGAESPVGKEAVLAIPKTATLIPAPREMRVTGGEYWAKKPPKMEKVDGIPPEGYELSIRPDGMTIRYSDDAGAYYANMTLFHEWKLWPRGFALAEVLWTYPDQAKRDFAEFSVRAAEYRRRLIRAHVNCAPLK